MCNGEIMTESKVLKGLNAEQGNAAICISGPTCTSAGPGSGKTRLLTHSIAYRIEQGALPEEIVAITFTNKAKEEIDGRLDILLGKQVSRSLYVGTYHGFLSANVLMPNKKHPLIKQLGYLEGFVIAEKDDADKILDEAIKEMNPLIYKLYTLTETSKPQVKEFMSSNRANGLFASDYGKILNETMPKTLMAFNGVKESLKTIVKAELSGKPAPESDLAAIIQLVQDYPDIRQVCMYSAWSSYEKRLKNVNALDYDGMLVVACFLLKNDKKLRAALAGDFKHILLDEFQDTNNVQWEAMKLIIDEMAIKNVFVVGDPDQCIYQFRNANPEIMRKFDQIFPGAQMKYLTMNYRSSPENVALCNAIKGFINEDNLKHPMQANSGSSGLKPVYKFFADEKDEAAFVITEALSLIAAGVKPDDIAILYRGKMQKRIVEMKLSEAQIPYQVVGDTSFYATKEVKDVISMLRMIANESDILGFARGLSASSIAVDGLTMRQAIDKEREEGKRVLPTEYLAKRFTTKGKPSESAIEKQNFLSELKFLISAKKDMTKESFIFNWLVSGLKEENNPLANTITVEQAVEIFNQGLASGGLHPMFMDDMAMVRSKFHEDSIAAIRAFYLKYYSSKLLKYSETTDKKDGIHDHQRYVDRVENVEQVFTTLKSKLNEGQNFNDAITELVLLTEQDIEISADMIQLMTTHASKGLEFPYVFVVGTESRSYFRSSEVTPEQIQNEACVFFVAASRAEIQTYLTGARGRTVNGEYNQQTDELIYVKCLSADLINNQTDKTGLEKKYEFPNSYQSEINDYTAPSNIPPGESFSFKRAFSMPSP